MKGRPDTNAENPKYLAEMVESMAYLTDEELAWLAHPRDGLQTVCKFLPTPADVHEFLRNKRAKAEQFQPAATAWRKIEEEPNAPWNRETDAERKRAVVRQLLGYDPDNGQPTTTRIFEVPSQDEVSNLRLKTPAAPISPQLVAKLESEGYPFIPKTEHAD